MAKIKKTNALRILDKNKVDYIVYSYDTSDGKNDGLSAAKKNGKDPSIVFKTLVTQGNSKEFYVFIIPVSGELDLKKAASVTDEKKIEMIPVKNLLNLTGYVKGGCSPIGMKKLFKTIIDSSSNKYNNIIVSAGKLGMHIEIEPQILAKVVEAKFQDVLK
jgi:Cys-tRNA(Pro)/Cys-tRNA(Cys) deacylase